MDSSKKYIIGYAALGEYTGHSAAYWRNMAADRCLPFRKIRRGNRVVFDAAEVDRAMKKGCPEWTGPTLDISLWRIHTLIEDMAGISHELMHDERLFDVLPKIIRKEDAEYIKDKLNPVVSDMLLSLIAAYISTDQAMRKKRTFLNAMRKGDSEAAWKALAHEWVFFKDTVMASITGTTLYVEDEGEILSLEEIDEKQK